VEKGEQVKTMLEYNGTEAFFDPRIASALGGDGLPIPDGSLVSVCAWHPGNELLSRRLNQAGYPVSHGCCETCKEILMENEP